MIRSYKYRLYPTVEQSVLIDRHFDYARLVYNLALEKKMRAWNEQHVSISAREIRKDLIELKEGYPWLKEVSSMALCESVLLVDVAYKNFFTGSGYPKFKKKGSKQSFQCGQYHKVDFDNGLLTVLKLPNLPIVYDRRFEGKVKAITISKTPTGKYYASLMVDDGIALPKKKKVKKATAIGIDMGLRHLAILSDGTKFKHPKFLDKNIERLKVLQRRASKKQIGSKNRAKANKKVALMHEKIANQRKDYIHNITSRIINDSQIDTVCVETLSIIKMLEHPELARIISDAAWSMFIRQLEYKAERAGKNIIKIARFIPSSKICSSCYEVNDRLQPLKVRRWRCPACGDNHDIDRNASINIKEIALNYSGWCSPVVPNELLALARA